MVESPQWMMAAIHVGER